ncbi:MAG: agmatinase [Halobacteriota archaeon]
MTSFAGAEASLEDADYVVVGVPLDQTTSGARGTGGAPREIRLASRTMESYVPAHDVDLAGLDVHDHGDVDVWPDVEESVEYAVDVVSTLAGDALPVVLGGEHTVSLAGVEAAEPDGVVLLDAHLDLKDEFQGTRYSHACVTRRLHESGLPVAVVGARAGSREEYDYARENHDVKVLDVAETSPDSVHDAVDFDRPYVSVDLDVVDPGNVSVGTPEAFGLTSRETRDVVRALAPDAVGFDVVETLPGDRGSTALAAGLVREFVAAHSVC